MVQIIFFTLNCLAMKTPLFPLKYKVQGPAKAPGGSRQGARRVQVWCPASPGMVPGGSGQGARRFPPVSGPVSARASTRGLRLWLWYWHWLWLGPWLGPRLWLRLWHRGISRRCWNLEKGRGFPVTEGYWAWSGRVDFVDSIERRPPAPGHCRVGFHKGTRTEVSYWSSFHKGEK